MSFQHRATIPLPAFLPLYNEAAQATGAFVFDAEHVERFGRLWDTARA